MIGPVLEDVRLALRTLGKDRAFTLLTVVTLAVAIGANTAIFSVVDGVLFRPLPFPDADRIVTVAAGTLPAPGRTIPDAIPFSDRGYWHFVDNNRVYEAFGGYSGGQQMALIGDGEPLQINAAAMTASAWEVLGTIPQRGRFPTPEEDVPGGPVMVVLSHGLWVGYFGSDPDIIGQTIELTGLQAEVIGVMPNGFNFPSPAIDLWIPLRLDPASQNFGAHSIYGLARLAPEVTIESALADAESLIARFGEAGYGETVVAGLFSGEAFVRTLKDEVVGDARQPLLILLGAMVFVLLIACSNVANLFLVRADARMRESAVRMALGSGRWKLISYVMTESVLLAMIGGVVGVFLAYLGTQALVVVAPASIPRLDEIGVRGPALLYTSGIAILAGLFFGLFPALRSGSDKMLSALRDAGRSTTIGSERHRARSAMVVAQVALALVVSVGSGLMFRSFQRLRAVDPGFRAENVLTFKLSPAPANYDNSPEVLAQFYDELLDGLEDIPGVARAGAVTSLPLQGIAGSLSTSIDEFPVADDEFPPTFLIRRATPGYFEAMGIDVLEGREFTDEDHQERLGSLIISESIKNRFWPDVSALGKRMAIAGAAARSVGVVRDVNAVGLDTEAEPYIYKPLLDSVGGGVAAMAMAVRANADPLSLVPAIRSLIASMDAELPISEIRLMEGIVSDSLSRTSFTMTLLLLAAAIALFLGSVGIYGVISYIVAQRTDEIGVRLALGAGAPEVRWMILMQGMRLAAVGVVVGLLAAVAMGRLMTSLLYGISPFDVTTFVIGAVIFLVVAALAGIIPAVRASRIPPAVALQSG